MGTAQGLRENEQQGDREKDVQQEDVRETIAEDPTIDTFQLEETVEANQTEELQVQHAEEPYTQPEAAIEGHSDGQSTAGSVSEFGSVSDFTVSTYQWVGHQPSTVEELEEDSQLTQADSEYDRSLWGEKMRIEPRYGGWLKDDIQRHIGEKGYENKL